MKITKNRLKQIIKEELEESDEALLMAIDNLAQKIENLGGALTDAIEDLDISVDFLSAAFIGGDPKSIGSAQKVMGRSYVPPRRLPDPPTQEQMKLDGNTLKELIREEVQATRPTLRRTQKQYAKYLLSTNPSYRNNFKALKNRLRKEHGNVTLSDEDLKDLADMVKETLNEELTKTDKADIKTLISKELDKTLKKEVKKILEDELSKALKSKATKEEIGEITKKVMKQLYKDLSYHHPYIIDRIKV
jgi:hypothetical protein